MERKKALTSSLEAKERIAKTFAVTAEKHDSLDIRLPIGLITGIYGLILIILGITDPQASVVLDININLVWGIVMCVFASLFLLAHKYSLKKNS